LSGSIRVRQCPEVEDILKKIRDHCSDDFGIEIDEIGAGELKITVAGCNEFTAGGALDLDELIQSLGPYALEAAVLSGVYDYEPGELIVAPPGEAGRIAMSRLRRDQIEPLLTELVAEDRDKLIEKLQTAHGE